MTNRYKVILIDDEVDVFCTEERVARCLEEGVELMRAHNIGELTRLLELYDGQVDALITGVNFGAGEDGVAADDQDSSGFNKVQQIVEKNRGMGRMFPYYICTDRPELVEERYLRYNQLRELVHNGRIFHKDDFWTLIAKLKQDVDEINSPAFRIRNLYALELQAAKDCVQADKLLLDILVYCESGAHDPQDTINYFNPLRKLVENIQDQCAHLRIIPEEIRTLNEFKRFVQGRSENGCQIVDGQKIMPQTLARSLAYYLDVVQDASHSWEDLKLGVDDYVRQQQNTLLLQTMVTIALELCLWFNAYSLENQDLKANEAKWRRGETF